MIMKTISVSEFRSNIKKYAELADTEKVIVNRGNGKAFVIVPLEVTQDDDYSAEFLEKIERSLKQYEEGKYKVLTSELKKELLGL